MHVCIHKHGVLVIPFRYTPLWGSPIYPLTKGDERIKL